MPNQAVHCFFHGQRLGIGVCVECRRVVCQECSTQFEGINRCAQCLARMVHRPGARPALREWGTISLLGASVAGSALFGSVLLLARLLAP